MRSAFPSVLNSGLASILSLGRVPENPNLNEGIPHKLKTGRSNILSIETLSLTF